MSTDKKRRSSFVRGRKSLGTVESSPRQSQGVDYILPEGLSENEKRRRLCFEESLLQLQREMPDLEEFDQFKVHVRTKLKEKLNEQKLEEEKMDEEEVKRLDPVQEAIDRQLRVLPGYIKMLKAEEETWDGMVRTRELLAERAQAQAEAAANNPIEFKPTLAISEVDKEFLSKRPDYAAIHSQVVVEFETTAGILEELPKFVCTVDQAVKSVAGRISRETLQLHETIFPPSEYNPLDILHNRLQYQGHQEETAMGD